MTEERQPPILHGIAGKILTLERKLDYTRDQLKSDKVSEKSRTWYEREAAAYEQAILALRFHRAMLDAEASPVVVLRDIVAAYDGPVDQEGRMRAAIRKARMLLEELEPAR